MDDYKRILLLTDSLGCPRPEVPVEITWTDKLMRKEFETRAIFYTYCEHGLHCKAINLKKIREVKPDIIVCQIGIVDACRRAMSLKKLAILKRIPFLSKHIKNYISKNHYKLTKRNNIHYTSTEDLKEILTELSSDAYVIAIKIATPCLDLKEKVYAVEDDVKKYNHALKQCESDRIKVLDPYVNAKPEEFLIQDGHHLNEYGHELVLNSVLVELNQQMNK